MNKVCKREVEEPRTKEAPSWWSINYPEDKNKDYSGEIIVILIAIIIILLILVLWNRFGRSGLMP